MAAGAGLLALQRALFDRPSAPGPQLRSRGDRSTSTPVLTNVHVDTTKVHLVRARRRIRPTTVYAMLFDLRHARAKEGVQCLCQWTQSAVRSPAVV